MTRDYSFIPYLYNEEVYVIRPTKRSEVLTLRGAVVIVDYPGIASLPTKEKILLNKILEAVKLQPVQVTVVNIAELRQRLSLRSEIRFVNATVILFTGKVPIPLKLDELTDKYKVVSVKNNEFVLADPLEIIDQEIDLKKELWAILRQLLKVA